LRASWAVTGVLQSCLQDHSLPCPPPQHTRQILFYQDAGASLPSWSAHLVFGSYGHDPYPFALVGFLSFVVVFDFAPKAIVYRSFPRADIFASLSDFLKQSLSTFLLALIFDLFSKG
jgi:hypothetical protein